MKKALIIIALMSCSSQMFAQENQTERKGWDGTVKGATIDKQKCPDYLDCTTGQIKYFEYKQDFTIDAPEVCGPLGVQSFSIKKGQYEVVRSSGNKGAVVTLSVMRWTPILPRPRDYSKTFTIDGTNPKGQSCSGIGNSCWYAANTGNDAKEKKIPIKITPIFENDRCVAIELQYRGKDPADPGF